MKTISDENISQNINLISFEEETSAPATYMSELQQLFDPLYVRNNSSTPVVGAIPSTKLSRHRPIVSRVGPAEKFSEQRVHQHHPNHNAHKTYIEPSRTDTGVYKLPITTENNLPTYPSALNSEKRVPAIDLDFLEKSKMHLRSRYANNQLKSEKSAQSESCNNKSSDDMAFIPRSPRNLELKMFMNTVESLKARQLHGDRLTCPKCITNPVLTHKTTNSNELHQHSCMAPPLPVHNSIPYDAVYGDLVPTLQPPKCPACSSTMQCGPYWALSTGAHRVAHVFPNPDQTGSEISGEAPSHWRLRKRWTIPQLEIHISTFLAASQQSTFMDSSSFVVGSTETITPTERASSSLSRTGSDPSIDASGAHLIRLVCDPHSTLVSELMLEVLANEQLQQDTTLNASAFQLRLLGRDEVLHPEARLCDCDRVQVCHRCDIPLHLVLEPYDTDWVVAQSEIEQTAFDPLAYLAETPLSAPREDDIFITYSVFQNALDQVRTCMSERKVSKDDKWYTKVQRASSSLNQSVKAVSTTVCQSIVFTDVLHTLDTVQACLLDVVRENSPQITSNAAWQNTIAATGWVSSIRRLKKHGTNADPVGKLCFNGPQSDTELCSPNMQRSLNNLLAALDDLESKLLRQLNAYFNWLQVGLRVNPVVMTRCQRQSRQLGKANKNHLSNVDACVAEDPSSTLEQQGTPTCRSSSDCTNPFTVLLIAMHRFHTNHTLLSGSVNGSLSQHVTSPHQSPVRAESMNNQSTGPNESYRIILNLTYAGRQLGRVYPHDSAHMIPGSSDTYSSFARDQFISDPGRFYSSQIGFPKVLKFDQSFTFPTFSINQLPREAMLSFSFISCKNSFSESNKSGTLIGWVNVPLFDAEGRLQQGTLLAGLWPPSETMHDYRPTWSQSNCTSQCPVIQLNFPQFDYDIEFPLVLFDTNRKKDDTALTRPPPLLKRAISEAQFALLTESIQPDMAQEAASQCLSTFTEAASDWNRQARQLRHPLMLGLGTLSVVNTSLHTTITASTTSNSEALTYTLPNPSRVPVEVLWQLRSMLTADCPNALLALVTGVLVTWPQEARGEGSSRQRIWSWTKLLDQVYWLLYQTSVPGPGLLFRLLMPDVVDQGIRHWAVRALASVPPDLLSWYLPQALEAINFDLHFDFSGLASLLLHRACVSMRFANALYWNLETAVCLTINADSTSPSIKYWRMRRLLILKAALSYLVTPTIRDAWDRQEQAIKLMHQTALAVKQAKACNTAREEILRNHLYSLMEWLEMDELSTPTVVSCSKPMEPLQPLLIDLGDAQSGILAIPTPLPPPPIVISSNPIIHDRGLRMPHNPGLLSYQLNLSACSYFTSFTCPLRLAFDPLDSEVDPIWVMFKAGDDLRQDALITQLGFLIDRIWLDAGLDLRMINYRIVPTGDRTGLVELVSECTSLRQIQQQGGGLTGAFKETVLITWLQSQSTTELNYKRALDNFLRSLAGSCVMTYVLGIGDRHSDNILIRNTGHLFHVDFAKVFGKVQTFVGINRDRVPFVLTTDMLHVLQTYSKEFGEAQQMASGFGNKMNGQANRYSDEGMQLFIDFCCEAYNLIRRNSHAILFMIELILSANIPGITHDSVQYVMRRLQPNRTEQEASQHFTELIRSALNSRMPAWNFFVHGLAQPKQAPGGMVSSGAENQMSQSASYRNLNQSALQRSQSSSNMNAAPGVPFSFSPKRSDIGERNRITAVVVRSVVKKRIGLKFSEHFFPVHVWHENSCVPTSVFRRLRDWSELCARLQDQMDSLKTLSPLPKLMNALTAHNITSAATLDNVQKLADYLIEENEQNDLVYAFFRTILNDERLASEEAANMAKFVKDSTNVSIGNESVDSSMTSPSVYTTHLSRRDRSTMMGKTGPALQLQLCLSDCRSRLDLLVKHGRALSLPGSKEAPDIYVKVYLASHQRGRYGKQKTSIVPHSCSPSFNTTFRYELTRQDILNGHLEVSAWHAVSLGENHSLGQVRIMLHSLRPGQSITKWFPLTSNRGIV